MRKLIALAAIALSLAAASAGASTAWWGHWSPGHSYGWNSFSDGH